MCLFNDITKFDSDKKFDYIFISSGSESLFTDMKLCGEILLKMKNLLKKGGKFVFAVDTIADKCLDDSEYRVSVSVKTRKGFDIVLKTRNYFDEKTHTQYSPGIYELYSGNELIGREEMDFQTHLYERRNGALS